MVKIKYILLPLALLVLAGCSDKTEKTTESEPSALSPVTDSSSSQTPTATANGASTNQPNDSESNTENPDSDAPTITQPKHIREKIIEEDDNETEVIVAETIPSNWYIRIIAEDTNRSLKTNLSQLGQLEESDAVQNHTLVSGGRFSNPYLDVVFVNPDGMPAGEYKTNYHVYGEGIDDRWRFDVVTDDSTADIRLSWSGLYALTPTLDAQNRIQYTEYRSGTNPLIAKMKLIDTTTGTEIPAMENNATKIYEFNMNGQVTRSFEWIVTYD